MKKRAVGFMVMRFEAHVQKKHYCVVHCGGPIGKLVWLGSPRVMRILWGKEVSRSSWRWGASALWQCPTAHGSLYSELAAKFRIWHTVYFLCFQSWRTTRQDIVSPDETVGGGGIRSVRPLWQMPKSLSVLLRKVAHQWHIYCVLSFTSIKILPLICM